MKNLSLFELAINEFCKNLENIGLEITGSDYDMIEVRKGKRGKKYTFFFILASKQDGYYRVPRFSEKNKLHDFICIVVPKKKKWPSKNYALEIGTMKSHLANCGKAGSRRITKEVILLDLLC